MTTSSDTELREQIGRIVMAAGRSENSSLGSLSIYDAVDELLLMAFLVIEFSVALVINW